MSISSKSSSASDSSQNNVNESSYEESSNYSLISEHEESNYEEFSDYSLASENEESDYEESSNYSPATGSEDIIGGTSLWGDLDEEIWLQMFKYSKIKSLARYSLVSKKWHKIINPIIRRSIRLTRFKYKQLGDKDENLSESEQFEAEAKNCINTNRKYSEHVKVFKLVDSLQFNLAVEFFSVFNQIQILNISSVSMREDILLFSLRHLIQLKELSLSIMKILPSDITEAEFDKIQFPSSLAAINLTDVDMDSECKAFPAIFNDHQNFHTLIYGQKFKKPFLTQFSKPYPRLKRISIFDHNPEIPSTVLKVFKYNPQLHEVKYSAVKFRTIFVDTINLYLNTLTHLSLVDTGSYANLDQVYPKMKLPNLKFLVLRLVSFNVEFFRTLLTSATQLESLDVGINEEWKKWTKVISQKCNSLKHLTLFCPPIFCPKGEKFINLTKSFKYWIRSSFACEDTLQTLKFINFNPLAVHHEDIEQFYKLNLIRFKDYENRYQPSQMVNIVDHVRTFYTFPIIKFEKSIEGFESYLKKTSNWTSTSYSWKTEANSKK
ncbi:hypothetical protein CONCODRAFT_80915 [Conidiobolus coronatus NRRL 28638]|uniref:F-box domain-containing protein n=1 Tax=Conidiobolus coronatus (strain ATCC 28846 / CBS 209.66 / NRRL 28638) TaxID=796925 RepID=A0A137NPW3_CONC2|nr:hypothetical protein CONCODRAFT_80915 [Conidiobolus coronatus NRRL 28638]|eukprot:KXN64793.1 hypothetical protein CONCODRAFT_80915 [Conidiobolus coronatus NRRL 28638]